MGNCTEFHNAAFTKADGSPSPAHPWQLEALKGFEGIILAGQRKELPPGCDMVLVASRQAGKNEVNARLEARMLALFRSKLCSIVKGAPTRNPQLGLSKERLKRVMSSPLWNDVMKPTWSDWYKLTVGHAALYLLSADGNANSVGHTASLYLSCDETQDVDVNVWEKVFAPMTASTNAPSLFSGTEWNVDSLLHQKRLRAEEMQRKTGIRLVYVYPWWKVAEANPDYAEHVQGKINEWGEDHVLIKTSYCCEPAESAGMMFEYNDISQMIGNYQRGDGATPGRYYVAGVDWCASRDTVSDNPLDDSKKGSSKKAPRDSTVVTIAECSFLWNHQTNRKMPVLRIVDHLVIRQKDPTLIVEEVYEFLFTQWNCSRVVLDCGGVGEFPSDMIKRRRPNQCTALFTSYPVKSRLGHGLAGCIKSKRMQMYRDDGRPEFSEFLLQFKECRRHELRENGMIKWGAPNIQIGGKDVHDDFALSAAYCYEAAEQHLASHHDPTTHGREESVFDGYSW